MENGAPRSYFPRTHPKGEADFVKDYTSASAGNTAIALRIIIMCGVKDEGLVLLVFILVRRLIDDETFGNLVFGVDV